MSILRTDRDKFLDGVGVAPGDLQPGVQVMVPLGTSMGTTSLVAIAVCQGPAEREGYWWFDVYSGGTTPLPQMYPVEHLLGIPAHGLTTPGLVDQAAANPS